MGFLSIGCFRAVWYSFFITHILEFLFSGPCFSPFVFGLMDFLVISWVYTLACVSEVEEWLALFSSSSASFGLVYQ
jgi:hypothetical protein